MTNAAGVGRGLYLLGVGVCPSDSGNQIDVLALGKVGKLVKSDYVVLGTLVLIYVKFRGTVAEVDYRSVFEPTRVA